MVVTSKTIVAKSKIVNELIWYDFYQIERFDERPRKVVEAISGGRRRVVVVDLRYKREIFYQWMKVMKAAILLWRW